MESILGQGMKREQDYDWLGAAEFYRKALSSVPELDFSRLGEVQERIGYAFYRAAMQAENKSEFRERIREAIANYEKAKEFFEKLGKQKKKPWILRCDAMTAWLSYWLLSDAAEKKKSLDECWNLTKEALKAFEKAVNMLEYGKTYNQLSMTAFFDYTLTWDFQAREKMIKEATEHGERTIALLSGLGDSYELTRAYVKTALYQTIIGFVFTSDMDEKERHSQKGLDCWQKATELSEETASLELLSFSGEILNWSNDEMLAQYDKALGYAKRTKDKYSIGTALDVLAYAAHLKCIGIEDPDKRLEFLQKALQYAEDTKHQFSSISFASPRSGGFMTGTASAEYYWRLATWETDRSRKQDLLEKALMEGTRSLKQAENTGYPEFIRWAHQTLSWVLVSLAQRETDLKEKKKLLEEALEHRKEYMSILEPLSRFFYWNLGYGWVALARLKSELSTVEKSTDNRKNMLEEAASFAERGLQLCRKHIVHFEKVRDLGYFALLGGYQYNYGVLLNRLYELTNNNEHQRRAIESFEEAAQSYQKLNMVGRVAECNWKAAISCDHLGEHWKATEYFNIASENYTSAAEKIPQLRDFYQEHALYMRAWSEIERGKHDHIRQEYGSAKKHYEQAAKSHQTLKQWNYLALNYHAWTQVENAEDLSRKEQSEKALQAFEKAAELFTKTKESLQTKLAEIESPDEKTMATALMKSSDLRREYCIGRIALEEARILDRKGDHYSSSERYGSAVQTFEKVAKELDSEQDRKEFSLMINLSRAWQKTMMAEAEVSSAMYGEAAELFKHAMEYTPHQSTSLLALANSSFCKASEAGTEFETTRDTKLFSVAKKHMEAAANYYLKAGFEKASTWVNANQALLDAYVYMSRAETKIIHHEKIRQYQLAEKYLERSAKLYEKAGYISKKDEALKALGKVREKHEFALSLSEAFTPPTAASSTAAFSAPAATREEAVGLERFEHASIHAYFSAVEEATVGEEFEVRMDLANVTKESGLLVRIDELIPAAFEVTREPAPYVVEGRSLNVKGRQITPNRVESIMIALRATQTGSFQFRPVVIYVDELGNFKRYACEAVHMTVLPPAGFQFKTGNAQAVFEYLTRAFIEDYMKRRLPQDKSGWRTLGQVQAGSKVPKSCLYGTVKHRGFAISELERRGLIETRMFLGERGRGGKIVKTRIFYEKDTIKRYIDQCIMKK